MSFEARLNRFDRSGDYTDRNGAFTQPIDGLGVYTYLDDRIVLDRVAQRDGDALAELYRRYSLPLYNFHLSLVHDSAAAEDLLQEVFLAVWIGAGSFRGASAVKTWIFNIAYKRSVSWLRKRRDLPIAEMDGFLEEPGAEQAALDNLHNQATSRAIRRALAGLTSDHRAVIELVFYHDCTYAEVAEILECPLGTVKSRVSYARRQLLSMLHIGELTGQGAG